MIDCQESVPKWAHNRQLSDNGHGQTSIIKAHRGVQLVIHRLSTGNPYPSGVCFVRIKPIFAQSETQIGKYKPQERHATDKCIKVLGNKISVSNYNPYLQFGDQTRSKPRQEWFLFTNGR